jgi:hypothetical protein
MGQARRRAADRVGRPGMRSPGRPSVARLACRQRFWRAIARGVSSEEAAAAAGVSAAVGVRWFREGGGMLAEGASTYVVLLGTRARTQNGHIRNDTRDVSRRTAAGSVSRFAGRTVSRVIARVRA